MGIFAPNLEKIAILLAVLTLLAAGGWLFIRSAVRSGMKGAARDHRDRMEDVRAWEESQRNLPR